MEETAKKTSLLSKALIWFLILSTGIVIYLSIKLIVVSSSFRDMWWILTRWLKYTHPMT